MHISTLLNINMCYTFKYFYIDICYNKFHCLERITLDNKNHVAFGISKECRHDCFINFAIPYHILTLKNDTLLIDRAHKNHS